MFTWTYLTDSFIYSTVTTALLEPLGVPGVWILISPCGFWNRVAVLMIRKPHLGSTSAGVTGRVLAPRPHSFGMITLISSPLIPLSTREYHLRSDLYRPVSSHSYESMP